MIDRLFKINNWYYYLVLCGVYALFTLAMNHFLLTDSLYYASFAIILVTPRWAKRLSLRPVKLHTKNIGVRAGR